METGTSSEGLQSSCLVHEEPRKRRPASTGWKGRSYASRWSIHTYTDTQRHVSMCTCAHTHTYTHQIKLKIKSKPTPNLAPQALLLPCSSDFSTHLNMKLNHKSRAELGWLATAGSVCSRCVPVTTEALEPEVWIKSILTHNQICKCRVGGC